MTTPFDEHRLSFNRLTPGGKILIMGTRCWLQPDDGGSERLHAVMAGVGDAMAPLVAFLEIMAIAASPAIHVGARAGFRLTADEVTLVDGMAALQRGRWSLGHQVMMVRLPPAALRLARGPMMKYAQTLARNDLWIGFRTEPLGPKTHPVSMRPGTQATGAVLEHYP